MDTANASPRPWRVENVKGIRKLFSAYSNILDRNGIYIAQNLPPETAALICDAVNLKARIDETMADESGYLHPVVLDGKPVVFVTPPPSEAEESRMHREYEASLLADRERFRRCYYEVAERNDRLRDIVRRLCNEVENMEDSDAVIWTERARRIASLIEQARAAIGEGA